VHEECVLICQCGYARADVLAAECAASDASAQLVELPTRVIDKLYQDAGVSSYHPDGDQQEKLHAFAHAVVAETLARLPSRPASSGAQAECGKSSGEAYAYELTWPNLDQELVYPAYVQRELTGDDSYTLKPLYLAAPQHSADIDAMRLSDERILEIARLHRGNHDWEAFSHFSQIGLLAFVRAIQEEQGK
jgi:hypothetical protein